MVKLNSVNVLAALFLRVQLRPAAASDRVHVLSYALHTSLQGLINLQAQ